MRWQFMALLAVLLLPRHAAAGTPGSMLQALALLTEMVKLSAQVPPSWNPSSADPPCDWSGIKCSDDNTTVAEVRLDDCSATGAFTSLWSTSLPDLTTISLASNYLTGALPTDWSVLTALTAVLLNDNRLNSTLPAQWSTLRNLRFINVTANQLGGSLPSAWSAITSLNTFAAEDNELVGSIPYEWRLLGELNHLNLAGNQGMCGDPSWKGVELALTTAGTNIGSPCPSPPAPPPVSALSPALQSPSADSSPALSSPSGNPPVSPVPSQSATSPPVPGPPLPMMPESRPAYVFVWAVILLLAVSAAIGFAVWSTCGNSCTRLSWPAWIRGLAGTVGWRMWGYQLVQGRGGRVARYDEVELGQAARSL